MGSPILGLLLVLVLVAVVYFCTRKSAPADGFAGKPLLHEVQRAGQRQGADMLEDQ